MEVRSKTTIMHTFDYEVYLKTSGSVGKCMLEPTDRLMEIFSLVGGHVTFFVDTTFLQLLQKDNPNDYQKVTHQMIKMAENGHRLELHLHPSWLDASKNGNGRWKTQNFERYSLFSLNQSMVDNLFESGIALIKKILKPWDSKYKVAAFRAGGWSIGDGKAVISAMKKFDIKIDSSVAPGMFRPKNSVQYFDFRRAPRHLPHWYYSDNPASPDNSGDMLEIPITTFRLWPLQAIIRRFRKNAYRRYRPEQMSVFGDGQGMNISDVLSSPQIFSENIRKAILPKSVMYTLQDVIPGEMDKMVPKVVNTISHPKNLSAASIDELHRISEMGMQSRTLLDYAKEIEVKQ